MFGKDGRYAAVDSGDSQIDIFATDCDRVKGFDNEGSWYWWLRSPGASDPNHFCSVGTDGTASNYSAHYSFGVAPAFCIE